ncbi:833_t:CDS:2, partial [Gigaspora rosea]
SLRDSVKLNQQEFILEFPSINDNINRGEYVEKSNSCIPGNNKRQFVNQRNERYDKLFIYDDLVVDKYFKLKESDKQDWITRDLEDHTQEFKGDKLYEPWLPDDWKLKKIEVIGIEYCSEKFKFRIQIKNAEGIKQIKMDDEDDIMNLAKYACNTLEYFSVYKKKLYPTEWRLLDIRFDLMSTLVKAGEHELVYYILSFGELIHIPKYLPWSDKENKSTTISIALSGLYKGNYSK